MLDAGDRSAAIEASSHGSALRRLDRVRFDALVFTNLSQDHLDLHGTMEEYFDAKRRLFTGAAAASGGGQHRRRVGAAARRRARGRAPRAARHVRARRDAEVRPEDLEIGPHGSRFRAAGIDVETRLRGRFNVENALGAVAAGLLLDLDEDAIAAGIASVEGVPGRFEAIDEGQPFSVLVDYAHTPDSLAKVLECGARARARGASSSSSAPEAIATAASGR